MEFRQLGRSGLKVPVLGFGTGTFGGKGALFSKWGSTDVKEATRLVDVCLEAGLNFFDTADGYSSGAAEEILGHALRGRRDQVLISTKSAVATTDHPNDIGSSRFHILRAVEASLKRLGTDYIDLYYMHFPDMLTPVEETLKTLDDLVRSGKVRYIGCSNFSGWRVMQSLAASDRYGYPRYVAYQGYYSLIGRDYEYELMPLALDQGIGTVAWSPLGWGRLTGKIRRGQAVGEGRIQQGGATGSPPVEDEYLYKVVDALDIVAKDTGKTIPQIALNWLLQRPSVSSLVIGARTEEQLKQNLGAIGWNLDASHVKLLEDASRRMTPYPYSHQQKYPRSPSPVAW